MEYEDMEQNVCVTGEFEDSDFEDIGLDAYEQERSLSRASRAELQIEFVGIPNKTPEQMFREYERERRQRTIPEWEPKRVQAMARKLKLLGE